MNNFDAIRLALAVLVLLGHCYPVTRGNDSFDPLGRLTGGQCDFPYVAVDFFFIISGLLIASSWVQSRSLWSYLGKRAARIYPGFIALWVVMLVVVPWTVEHHFTLDGDSWAYAPLHILVFQDLYYPGAFARNPSPRVINVSLWTISHEFRCYLLLPVLAVMAFGRRRWLVGMALGISLVALAMQPPIWHAAVQPMFRTLFGLPSDWARFASCFLAGVAFYCYRNVIPMSWLAALLCAIALAASAFVQNGLPLAIPIAGTYLLLWAAYQPVGLSGFARYGDFSYGVYLYAFFIQQLIVQYAGHPLGPWGLFVRALPLSLAAGVGSWWLVERWFLRNRRHRTGLPSAA